MALFPDSWLISSFFTYGEPMQLYSGISVASHHSAFAFFFLPLLLVRY